MNTERTQKLLAKYKEEILTNDLDHRIAVMEAFLDGTTVDYRPKGTSDWTTTLAEPLWDWANYDYRVTPQATAAKNNNQFIQFTRAKLDDMVHRTAVMEAYIEGKSIEFRSKGDRDVKWRSISRPSWAWDSMDYRVKPDPMVIWVNLYASGRLGTAHESREAAEQALHPKGSSRRTIKFMEVLEDEEK